MHVHLLLCLVYLLAIILHVLLKELIIMVLLVNCFHGGILIIGRSWPLVALHHLVLLIDHLVLESDGPQPLMPWRREWPHLLLQPGWRNTIVSTGVSALRELGAQGLPTFLDAVLADGAVIPVKRLAATLEGAGLRVSRLGGPAGRAQAVEEVRVFAVSVTIAPNHLLKLLLFSVVLAPFLIIVRTLSFLQLVQQNFVLVDYFGERTDPIRAIQGVVRVESLLAASGLSRCWPPNVCAVDPLHGLASWALLLRLKVYLKHFFEQHPVLVLDLTLPLHFIQLFFIVVDDVLWLWGLLHVDAGLDISEALHMHEVLLHLLTVADEPI